MIHALKEYWASALWAIGTLITGLLGLLPFNTAPIKLTIQPIDFVQMIAIAKILLMAFCTGAIHRLGSKAIDHYGPQLKNWFKKPKNKQ